jgi:hypothetical protein
MSSPGRNEDVEAGVLKFDANLIYKSSYESIPTLAGKRVEGMENLYDGVGRSVIAGEIHDCDNDPVAGAVVSSDNVDGQTKHTYTDADPDDPTPDPTRDTQALGTNTDGLYLLINAPTDDGQNVHVITGVVQGDSDETCRVAMSGTVMAFPDSVTIYSNYWGAIPVIDNNQTFDAGPVPDAGDTPAEDAGNGGGDVDAGGAGGGDDAGSAGDAG